MKNIVFVFVMVLMLASCKEATKNLMSSVTGKINQVLVIAEKNTWDGPVGDTIREFFGQDQDGLPQSEDRKSTRLNSSHLEQSRMPSSA